MAFVFRPHRRRRVSSRPRQMGGNRVVTRSGRVLKVNSSIPGRWAEYRAGKARRKVERLRGLPKSRLKRVLWRLNPRRQAEYWFSRDGAIMALKVVGITIFLFFVLTIGVFSFFRKDIKNLVDLSNAKLGGSLAFYDRSGKTFLGQDYDKVKRLPVPSEQISKYMKDATVAVEDRNFYSNHGFDIKGIIRAAFNDIVHHGNVQGGSTITQQVVKQSEGWSMNRTFTNKVKELILAVELERQYSKDDILTQYLNLSPYGGLDYGVQVAAQDYFHVNAKDLTLPQAAMLAAIPKSPALYSPYNKVYFDKKAFKDRYNYVLDSMADTGKVTRDQANSAKKFDILATVHTQPSKFSGQIAPYFLKAVEHQIEHDLTGSGPNNSQNTGPWKVITTLDMDIQRLAEEKVQANKSNLFAHGADETATVVEDVKTGQYLAMVGGLDFNKSEINFAQWPISPGSSFKPYDYSTLIENHNNAGAGSVLYDQLGPVPGYPCTNKAQPPRGNCLWDFDRRSPGPMTLRYALGGSRNIPAVKAMASALPGKDTQTSVNKVINTAERMMNNDANYSCYKDGADVTQENKADRKDCFTSSAIGDGAFLHLDNHLNGLATLGRMGLSIRPTYILRIEDASKKVINTWKQPVKGDVGVDQVVNPQTAYILNDMLSDPGASYFSLYQKFQHYKGWHIAVKTGTTNNSTDGLMMAWTTKYAVGTWVGFHTRTKALYGPMENITMPVTRDIIQGALDKSGGQPANWTEPAGIQHLPAFHSRYAYSTQTGAPSTDLYPSWYVPASKTTSNATIDKVSNKLATNCTPSLAKQNATGNFAANQFSIDIFYGPGAASNNNNTKSNDDVHSCSDAKPQVTLTVSDNHNGTYTVTAAASAGTHPLTDPQYPQFPGTINLSANGNNLRSCTGLPADAGSCSTSYTPPSGGSYTFTAQVIDSVLYDSSASQSVTVASSPHPASTLNFSEAKLEGGKVKFSWSGGTGPYTVTSSDGSTTYCTGGAGSSNCTYNNPLAPGTTVKIQDSSSPQQTDSATVSA